MMLIIKPLCALFLMAISTLSTANQLPIFDSHLHYSHDAWERLPPKAAIEILKKAGITGAMVSSSSDDGTQKLFKEAPGLVIPVLRPYRARGELSSWIRDTTVIGHLEARLKANLYVAIGEYHVFGSDADLPVMRRVVELAREYKLFLHSHSDADAVERQFKQDPNARILWAHSGFDNPEKVRDMLRKYKNLWCDLAFRSDHASGGKVDPAWRAVFMEFPDRFMVGSDTFTPERWYFVVEHANWSRQWLADLPKEVAEKIAYKNGMALFGNKVSAPNPKTTQVDKPVAATAPLGVKWQVKDGSIKVGQSFSVLVQLQPETASLLKADATMPEHRHGMNYRTSIKPITNGQWQVDGFLFHMPGRWEFSFEAQVGERKERFQESVQIR